MWTQFSAWLQRHGAAPLPPREFIAPSPNANIYVYPAELDYLADRPLDET